MNPLLISGIFDIGQKLIGRLFPDPAAQAAAKLELLKLQQSGELQIMANETSLALAQIEVNKNEAASSNVFVSGARPFIMWVCGAACVWNWIGLPIAKVGLLLGGITLSISPADMSEMMPILMGMLGLGGFRTIEKIKGVASK